jgi:hypothetical protein
VSEESHIKSGALTKLGELLADAVGHWLAKVLGILLVPVATGWFASHHAVEAAKVDAAVTATNAVQNVWPALVGEHIMAEHETIWRHHDEFVAFTNSVSERLKTIETKIP